MIYATFFTAIIILVAFGVCVIAYVKYREEEANDIAEQIIREHQKEIEELKNRRYYE
jgi:heme/copper-type cytochrome/quinol oxidase subunit 2